MGHIFETHTGRYAGRKFWWRVPKRLTKKKMFDLWLTMPSNKPIKTPSVVLMGEEADPPLGIEATGNSNGSLNIFHPNDYKRLAAKGVLWKVGLYQNMLQKPQGRCWLCEHNLAHFEPDAKFEIHHVKPKQFGGTNIEHNMAML